MKQCRFRRDFHVFIDFKSSSFTSKLFHALISLVDKEDTPYANSAKRSDRRKRMSVSIFVRPYGENSILNRILYAMQISDLRRLSSMRSMQLIKQYEQIQKQVIDACSALVRPG